MTVFFCQLSIQESMGFFLQLEILYKLLLLLCAKTLETILVCV